MRGLCDVELAQTLAIAATLRSTRTRNPVYVRRDGVRRPAVSRRQRRSVSGRQQPQSLQERHRRD